MELDIIRDRDFAQWLLAHIRETQSPVDDVTRKLANGPRQGENVEPRAENTFQEGEVSNPQSISVATYLDGINIISDEEAEEVDLNEFEALRYTMNSNLTRIRDEEQDEEEFEEIESEEDEQDEDDHDSSDNDDDMEIDD
ncbi:hypothetical protein Salat_1215000 [Sesamum alatum]|uniref:Uncharacterized protein n=1 Tax=Sesamum alatum TaxID=300844 RepID=A0AAE1YGH0_9LAMI|nr:hypothetical protein Salat_1215000 [Sesamum alatum]